ncbi:MAG: hypothetical protein KME45_31720 [Stenomitos rutilans HA7619-LM2]|jgi:hypothetical protein|nr:hypothetical protein [Stenomitos rutilans HA7619-LM2]
MLIKSQESCNPLDEILCFSSGQIELGIKVPGVPLRQRADASRNLESIGLFPQAHHYRGSPIGAYCLYKLYEAVICGGYGEYRILVQRKNNGVHVTVSGGLSYRYLILPEELKHIQQTFNHMTLYKMYIRYQYFEEFL